MKHIPWRTYLLPLGVVATVILVGVVLWLATRAAGSFIAAEPESGALSGPAESIVDSTASGGGTVNFPGNTPPTSPVATIRIANWNVNLNNSQAAEEIPDIFRFADVMGIQELSYTTERSQVQNNLICSSCAYDSTWTTHTYDSATPNKEAILWKKAVFNKISTGYIDISPRTTVEGGEVVAPRFTTWARLQDKATGKQFYILNQHLVSGVEDNGKPISGVPERLALYDTHMDKLLDKIKTFKADNIPIFSTGDFNVDYRYDHVVNNSRFPYNRMGDVGAKSSYDLLKLAGISSSQGSRDVSERLIDYVWTVVRSDVSFKSEDISSSTHGSDHYALFTTVEIR